MPDRRRPATADTGGFDELFRGLNARRYPSPGRASSPQGPIQERNGGLRIWRPPWQLPEHAGQAAHTYHARFTQPVCIANFTSILPSGHATWRVSAMKKVCSVLLVLMLMVCLRHCLCRRAGRLRPFSAEYEMVRHHVLRAAPRTTPSFSRAKPRDGIITKLNFDIIRNKGQRG